jgi:hypothetical protein
LKKVEEIELAQSERYSRRPKRHEIREMAGLLIGNEISFAPATIVLSDHDRFRL